MDVQCLKIKVRPGKTGQVVQWMTGLKQRRNEVYTSLRNETMAVESVFLDRQSDGDYLFFYTRAESLQTANQMMLNYPTDLDREALVLIQETWADGAPLEVLFDVDRIATLA